MCSQRIKVFLQILEMSDFVLYYRRGYKVVFTEVSSEVQEPLHNQYSLVCSIKGHQDMRISTFPETIIKSS